MDRDIEAIKAACDRFDDGDPSGLLALLAGKCPNITQERVRACLAKLKPSKPPTPRDFEIAEACRHYQKRRPEIGGDAAHAEACQSYNIEDPKILDNALRRVRSRVNEAWDQLNLAEASLNLVRAD